MSPGRRRWRPVLGCTCRPSLLLTTLATGSEYNLQSVPSNNSFVKLTECICLFSVKLGFNFLLKSLDGEWIFTQYQITKYAHNKYTRNSSGDEIANVNFLHDDIVHIQNTIDSCINSATDRRGGYVLERMFTKFSKITQCNNGHYAVQGHSRSPILVPIESSYTTSY